MLTITSLFLFSEKVDPGDIVIPGEKDVVPVGELTSLMDNRLRNSILC